MLLGSEKMCAAFQQHFKRLSRGKDGSTMLMDLSSYLDGFPRLSVADAMFYEKPITITEIWEAMNDCTSPKSSGSDYLLNEFCVFMLDLIGGLLADVSS